MSSSILILTFFLLNFIGSTSKFRSKSINMGHESNEQIDGRSGCDCSRCRSKYQSKCLCWCVFRSAVRAMGGRVYVLSIIRRLKLIKNIFSIKIKFLKSIKRFPRKFILEVMQTLQQLENCYKHKCLLKNLGKKLIFWNKVSACWCCGKFPSLFLFINLIGKKWT